MTSIAPQRISEVVDDSVRIGHALLGHLARLSDAESQQEISPETLEELLTAAIAIRNALRGVSDVASLEARRVGL
ncbi:MAG: hypothetical protein ACO3GP_01430 [Candidatus Limnocylindrus sp.]